MIIVLLILLILKIIGNNVNSQCRDTNIVNGELSETHGKC